ncbi:MAG: 30S ribosomal protein S2 [Verrucomicrobiae bacterium]|nr:30S ribosomal protein S2 [Verrucomicrobiae bacterium]
MKAIDVKELLEAGVHFGHQCRRWNPRMKRYIFEKRNGIHIINLNDTAKQLVKACEFLKNTALNGGDILIVGTKKQAQEAIKEAALRSQSYYVTERWLGGMLTNMKTIRKSINRLAQMENMQKDGSVNYLPKKELAAFNREIVKLHRNLDGIREMEASTPTAIVIVDINHEDIALREARRLKIPVVAIVDTNVNPEFVDYPVAGNDDAIRSIKILVNILADAIVEGRASSTRKRPARKAADGSTPDAAAGRSVEVTEADEIEAISA